MSQQAIHRSVARFGLPVIAAAALAACGGGGGYSGQPMASTTGTLVVAHAARVLAKKGYYLCYPEQKAHLPALQTFRAWLMEGVDVVA